MTTRLYVWDTSFQDKWAFTWKYFACQIILAIKLKFVSKLSSQPTFGGVLWSEKKFRPVFFVWFLQPKAHYCPRGEENYLARQRFGQQYETLETGTKKKARPNFPARSRGSRGQATTKRVICARRPLLFALTLRISGWGCAAGTLEPLPYPRVNCLKTIPFTAAHKYIAHIWQ